MFKLIQKISKPLSKIIENKPLLITLIIINAVATILSFLTYVPGIFYMPWYLAIFKPLCPTYIGLFTIVLLIYAFRKQFPRGFTELAFIVVFSLGIISGVFYYLWLQNVGYTSYHFRNLFTHPLLFLESLILVPHLKKLKLQSYILIAVWLVLDFYFLIARHLFNYFDHPATLPFQFPVTVAMALLIIFAFSLTLFVKQEN